LLGLGNKAGDWFSSSLEYVRKFLAADPLPFEVDYLRRSLAFAGLALLGIFTLDLVCEKPSGGGATLAKGISVLLSQPDITPKQIMDVITA
jgi:hypothetical protein